MKKLKGLIIFSLIFLLMMSIITCVVFVVVLPAYVEKKLLPDLAKKSGIDAFTCNVRKIGFRGADFARIKIGDHPQGALYIDSIRIDYSLSGLVGKHLKSVQVCGLAIKFQVENGKIVFPGIDTESILSAIDTKESNKTGEGLLLPVTFDHIVFKNAMLMGELNQQMLRLPLKITIIPQNGRYDILKGNIQLFPFESIISTEVIADLRTGNLKLQMIAKNLHPGNYLRYLEGTENIRIQGAMDITANAYISIDPLEISNTLVIAESHGFYMNSNGIEITNSNATGESFSIEIYSGDSKNWSVMVTGIGVKSLPIMEIPVIRAELQIGQNVVESTFMADIILNCIDNCQLKMNPPIQCTWNGIGKFYLNSLHWELELENVSGEALSGKKTPLWNRIEVANTDVGFFMPEIIVSGKGNIEDGRAELDVKLKGIHLDAGAVSLEMPMTAIGAEIISNQKVTKPSRAVDFDMRFANPGIRMTATDIGFKEISLIGRIGSVGNENDFKATFGMLGGFITDTLYGVRAEGINLEIPLVWPFDFKADRGSFIVDSIRLGDKHLGKILATFQQDGHGGIVKGAFDSRLFPGLSLKFEGRAGNTPKGLETSFNYRIADYKIMDEVNLGLYLPEGDDIFVTGLFNLEGDFYQSGPKMGGAFHMRAQEMNISLKEPLISINNVNVDFRVADLFQMRSLPHQTIRFDSATMGNIGIDSGAIDFQMQSSDLYFIEKATFRWCDGNVDTNSAIVSLPFKSIGLTFYCDRLKLARVMEQLGGVRGEGEGAVNGRIPVRYDDGTLRFDNAFLYSTPGEGGTIRLTDTDFLMSGIPEGTPHFAQIDLAREALKNYRYDWAKLDITTEEERLNLKLKLDGKPLDVLPFEFQQDFGGFARVEAGSPGSRFQGIRLDVNFNLPLDQVLRYGKGFQDMFKLEN